VYRLPVTGKDVAVNVACPVAAHKPACTSVPFSLNVTVPDASVAKLATVAVKVMLTPNAVVAGVLSARLVVVVAFVTVWVTLAEVLAETLLSPP